MNLSWALSQNYGGRLVTFYGVLLSSAAFLYTSPLRASPEATFIAAFGLILLLIPSLGLMFGGYWLSKSSFSTIHQQRILNWCGWGSLGIASLVSGMVLYLYWIGYNWGDLGYIVLMGLATGGSIGFVFGVKTESVRRHADKLDTHRQNLQFLNRLLRHNILNGMAVIQGYTELLQSDNNSVDDEMIAPINAQSKRIVHLIQNVRVLSDSIVDGLSTEPVDLSELLSDAIEATQESFPKAEFRIQIEPEVIVAANEVIDAAFENVLWNAVEHNDSDTPLVTVSLQRNNEGVIVEISDNGPGIPDDSKDDLFDPGEHGDSGIGLFIVESLISQYDGQVRVTDNDPRGTTFLISLPLADEDGKRTLSDQASTFAQLRN